MFVRKNVDEGVVFGDAIFDVFGFVAFWFLEDSLFFVFWDHGVANTEVRGLLSIQPGMAHVQQRLVDIFTCRDPQGFPLNLMVWQDQREPVSYNHATPTSKFQEHNCCIKTEWIVLFWFFVGVAGFLVPSSLLTKSSKIHHLQGLVVKSLVWLCEMFNVFVLVAHNPGTAKKQNKKTGWLGEGCGIGWCGRFCTWHLDITNHGICFFSGMIRTDDWWMLKSEANKCIVFVKFDEVWHVTNGGGTRWHPCEEQMPPTSIGRIRAAATECQA